MDFDFGDITNLFEDIERIPNLEEIIPVMPRITKCYLRDYVDPFDFYSDAEFKQRYRFTKTIVRQVLLPELAALQVTSNRGLPIPVVIQLLIALRFYATGSFQKVCGDLISISQPTVCHIVQRVSRALAGTLQKYIKFPRSEELNQVKNEFKNLGAIRNFPGLPDVIGAIDCTHIKITRPRGIEHSEAYRNRHGWFSVNVQAIVAPDMTIQDVVARWPGSAHDSRTFRNSRIYSRLLAGEFNGTLVGDGGYACTAIMLTPLRTPSTLAEERYNKVQIKTRNVVERTFGVLKRRFPCLQRGLAYKLTTSCNIILACCVLHNIALKYEKNNDYEDFEEVNILSLQPQAHRTTDAAEGLALRSELIRSLYS